MRDECRDECCDRFTVVTKPLFELKQCLQNLFRCLFNHVKGEMAAHTAKCLGSVRLFSSELLIRAVRRIFLPGGQTS